MSYHNGEELFEIVANHAVEFEKRTRTLNRQLKLNLDINLVESVVVALVLSYKRSFKKGSILHFSNSSLRVNDYYGLLKRYLLNAYTRICFLFSKKKISNKVCFFEYYGSNLGISEPYANIDSKQVIYVSLRREVEPKLNKKFVSVSIDCFGLLNYVILLRVNKASEIFCHELFNSLECQYNLDSQFRLDFLFLFKNELLHIAKVINQCRSMLNSLNPKKALFTTDSPSINRLIIMFCKRMNIETIAIQHGLIPDSKLLRYIFVSKYLLWGQYYRNLISKYNNNSNLVLTVVGNFKQHLISKDLENVQNVKNKIFVATSPPSGISLSVTEYMSVLDSIRMLAVKRPEYFIFIKPHPSEDIAMQKNYFMTCGKPSNIELLKPSTNAYTEIASSSVVIIVSSTIALEALLLNKRVLSLNYGFFNNLLPFQKNAFYHEVTCDEKLVKLVDRLLEDINRNEETENNSEIDDYCLKTFRYEEAISAIF